MKVLLIGLIVCAIAWGEMPFLVKNKRPEAGPIVRMEEQIQKEKVLREKIKVEEKLKAERLEARNPQVMKPQPKFLGKALALLPDAYEPNNSLAQAATVTLPCTLKLSMTVNDTDVFKVAVDSANVLMATMAGTQVRSAIEILDKNGSGGGQSGLTWLYSEEKDTLYVRMRYWWMEQGDYTLILHQEPGFPVKGTFSTGDGDSLPYGCWMDVYDTANSNQRVNGEWHFFNYTPDYTLYLPAGTYKIYAAFNEPYFGFYYNQAEYISDATPVVVMGPVNDINFQLRKGGVIAGRIKDVSGNPVKDVYINADCRFHDNFSGSSATSDTSGFFRIEGLLTEKYSVSVISDSFVSQYYNLKDSPLNADSVAVAIGIVTGNIDFTLRKGGKITGTISAIDGKPLPEYLYLVARNVSGSYSKSIMVNVGKGKTKIVYEFSGLNSGLYYVKMGETYYGNAIYAFVYYPNANSKSSAVPVSVVDRETTPNINFNLERSGVIQGTITSSDNKMRGNNVDVYLQLYNDRGTLADLVRYYADSIAPGTYSYTVFGVPKGVYKVAASFYISGNDTSSSYQKEFYCNAKNQEEATPITIVPGDTVTSIDFVLDPAGAIKGYLRYQETGAPVINRNVYVLVDTVGDLLNHWSNELYYNALSDSTGRFQIRGLPSGCYKVQAMNFNSRSLSPIVNQFYNGAVNSISAQVLTVTAPNVIDSVNFSIEKGNGGMVTGKINIEDDPHHLVCAFDSAGFLIGAVHVEHNGSYLIDGLPSGFYKIGVYCARYFPTPLIFYHPSDTSFANAKTIKVVKGDTTKDIDITIPDVSVEDNGIADINETAILSNLPNPFNPSTTIRFSVAHKDVGKTLRIMVYDINGSLVRELSNGKSVVGAHKALWDGTDRFNRGCASGIYLVKMVVGDKCLTRRIVMMK